MSIDHLGVLAMAALALSIMPSRAGPCSQEIDSMQARIDAMIDTAAAGSAGHSIAAAEERLREGARAERAMAAMAQARVADWVGDAGACERALADVQRAIGP